MFDSGLITGSIEVIDKTGLTISLTILTSAILCSMCNAQEEEMKMGLAVTSSAFEAGKSIPSTYTCDGADISPPLAWENAPEQAKSIVLICDDPDAPGRTWVHWVCYDMPPATNGMKENIAKADTLPAGGKQGMTDFRRVGYGGPCPPGGTHRYFFKIYALDTMLNLPAGKTKADIERAMDEHILDSGELMGTYSRKK